MSSVNPGAEVPPPPTQGDLETESLLKEHDATLLTDISTRAEKWAAGLAAVTGLVSTALFIKGPEEIMDVPEPFRVWIAILVGVALLSLIIGTLLIYTAAYGSPLALRKVDRTLPGLQNRYESARIAAGERALRLLGIAVGMTLLGAGLLFAAAMITWFAEGGNATTQPGVCVEADGVTVELGEIHPAEGRQELTVVPCPK
jgi:hypothetical protein